MLEESFPLIFKLREIEILKNMPVKIWLPWKRQVTWTVTCHIKFFPDNFKKKSPSLIEFALILKKLLTYKVAEGRIPPPSSLPPPGLNRVNGPFKYILGLLLGKNQFAVTQRMHACIEPNLDNTY